MKELNTVIRIDIAWDIYKSYSLKNATRQKRGCSTRCLVSSSTRIPGNSGNSNQAFFETKKTNRSCIPSRLHLGSVPSRQAICSHAKWLGLGEVRWTIIESCMDSTSWDCQSFYYELLGCKCKKTCKGTASVTGQTCCALHWITVCLWWDSVMETELTARPDTNRGLHYIPTYMCRGQLSWIQIRSYTYSLPEKVSHSYCFSNCLRFKTVDLRNYV